jgi:hypothetical protein
MGYSVEQGDPQDEWVAVGGSGIDRAALGRCLDGKSSTVRDPIEECIADLDSALVLLKRARWIPEGRAVLHARVSLYAVVRRLELLQPSADQWARIDERLEQINMELAQFD